MAELQGILGKAINFIAPGSGWGNQLESQGGYNQQVQQEQQRFGSGGYSGQLQAEIANRTNAREAKSGLSAVNQAVYGQVLGATDKNAGNTGNNNNNSGGKPPAGSNVTDLDAWARNNGYTGYNNYLDEQAAKSREADMNQISEAYAPTLQALVDAEGNVRSGAKMDEDNLIAQVMKSLGDYDVQGNELTQDNQTQQNRFNDKYKSAFADAVRSYNALNQQQISRFGGGNSASQAIGELAQQEFLRQQGQNQVAQTQGNADFGVTFGKIKQFVASKKSELELYKNQALSEIRKNTADKLTEIALRKGDVEANKTKDRLALLQQAKALTAGIQQADQQFRRELGVAAANKMQEISGRAFSAPEIIAVVSQFDPTFGATGTPTRSYIPAYNPNSKKQDEFSQLNPLG